MAGILVAADSTELLDELQPENSECASYKKKLSVILIVSLQSTQVVLGLLSIAGKWDHRGDFDVCDVHGTWRVAGHEVDLLWSLRSLVRACYVLLRCGLFSDARNVGTIARVFSFSDDAEA